VLAFLVLAATPDMRSQARLGFEARSQIGFVGLFEYGDQAHAGKVVQQGTCLLRGHAGGAGHLVQVDGLAAVFLLDLGEGPEDLLVRVTVIAVTAA
jgi:hypothetical protein